MEVFTIKLLLVGFFLVVIVLLWGYNTKKQSVKRHTEFKKNLEAFSKRMREYDKEIERLENKKL